MSTRADGATRRPLRAARERVVLAVLALSAVLLASCVPVPAADLPRRSLTDPPAVRTAPDVVGIAYGPDPAHRLDLVRRTTDASRGTIVWIHGGGFTTGSRSELFDGGAEAVVEQRRRGFDVVSIDYRLAPAHPFPAARDDVVRALRWLDANGAALGLSDSRTVLVGHSAGGTLAAMVATTPGAPTAAGPAPRVDAWVSVSGIASFDPILMAADFPGDWGVASTEQRRVSEPIATIDGTDPPGLLVHGDRDRIVDDWHSTTLFTIGWLRGATIDIDLVGVGPDRCRGHTPLCGADLDLLDRVVG